MVKPAIQKSLWAPIRISRHGDWPLWIYVRVTRRDAKSALLEGVRPSDHKAFLNGIRFARVTVIEQITPKGDTTGGQP